MRSWLEGPHPISALRTEYSLWTRDVEENAAAAQSELSGVALRRIAEAAPVGATARTRYSDMSTVHR